MGVTSHQARIDSLYKSHKRIKKGIGPSDLVLFARIMQGYYDQFKEDFEFEHHFNHDSNRDLIHNISMLLTSISRSHPFKGTS